MNGDRLPNYEVHALRYSSSALRPPRINYSFPDAHDVEEQLEFYIWAIRGGGRTIIVDTGFDETVAGKRKWPLHRRVDQALASIGIDAATVPDVVLTHLHLDHAGGTQMFPRARFHLQDREMAYCTGRCMCHARLRGAFETDHVVQMVRYVHGNRVRFHDGTSEIAPGITLHLTGGHTGGLQVVRVHTERGWVVLASDAAHFYHSLTHANPYPAAPSLADALEAIRVCEGLADSPAHIIPGHDPQVLTRYPLIGGGVDGVRLDLPATLLQGSAVRTC
jgi:glyoxylase-like metal-dependent hydrolase (beta-lactamase superfamily II)